MKKILFLALIGLFSVNAFAFKTYMSLLQTSSKYGIWIVINDSPCQKPDGNVAYANGNDTRLGCWVFENDKVKISFFDGQKEISVDKSRFLLMKDDDDVTRSLSTPSNLNNIQNNGKKILTCQSDNWVGDIEIERDTNGMLIKIIVGGDDESFKENGTTITFSHNSLNFNLSTLTGIFNYETSGFKSYLNSRLLKGANVKGSGNCRVNENTKQF
jgi:hypothetical protein